MKKLLFENPTFEEGTNVTVRRGDKWAEEEGTLVSLCDLEENQVARGIITRTHTLPFEEIPAAWLAVEHDPACRTREGLLAVMQDIYPGFEETDLVTVVLFDVVG